MSSLMALSITTGILCGIWTQISIPIGLMAWAGFAGTTTYFATGESGPKALFSAIRQNMFGVLCAMGIIILSDYFSFPGALMVFSGLITFVMCIAGAFKYLSFIPGTFLGAFSTFAADGNYQIVILSLLAGAILGISCDLSGKWLYSKFGKPEKDPNEGIGDVESENI